MAINLDRSEVRELLSQSRKWTLPNLSMRLGGGIDRAQIARVRRTDRTNRHCRRNFQRFTFHYYFRSETQEDFVPVVRASAHPLDERRWGRWLKDLRMTVNEVLSSLGCKTVNYCFNSWSAGLTPFWCFPKPKNVGLYSPT